MDKKYQVLNQYFGYSSFRSGQEELIDAQMAGRDVVGVMPTGGGKSLCYQIPALLSDGITLVISPLISLMKDQVAALKKVGITAAYINSSLSIDQIKMVYKNMLANKYKIVYIAPERLLTEGFLLTIKSIKISIVSVDEAHCISQWGQDFRPSYLRIVGFLKLLGYRPVVSAFTATATPEVRNDIEHILELKDPLRVVTGFDRPNLRFEVLKPRNKPSILLELIKNRQDKSGIVYCSTRRDVEKICLMLQNNGILATRYHAGMLDEERRINQDDFVYDRCNVIVATNAFGMGIDKSNVAYVIHYNMPQSVEAYYQEAGRAGRDGSNAECILLYSPGDIRTAKYLIEHPVSNDEISENQRKQVREQELLKLDKMVNYCKTTDCFRGYILEYFGEYHRKTCNNCGNCSMVTMEKDITTQARMILSCVKRIRDHLGYSVGVTILIRVLRGSRDRRILDLELDALSTYGLMKNTSRVELCELIENLETEGYLYKNPTNETIILTERSRDVLFRDKKVKILMRKPLKANERSFDNLKVDEGLFEALKALRLRIATNEKVPAYIVFSNSTLQDMVSKKPTTMTEFLKVSGVGKYKAEQYGEMFITEIKRYKDGDYYDRSGANKNCI